MAGVVQILDVSAPRPVWWPMTRVRTISGRTRIAAGIRHARKRDHLVLLPRQVGQQCFCFVVGHIRLQVDSLVLKCTACTREIPSCSTSSSLFRFRKSFSLVNRCIWLSCIIIFYLSVSFSSSSLTSRWCPLGKWSRRAQQFQSEF